MLGKSGDLLENFVSDAVGYQNGALATDATQRVMLARWLSLGAPLDGTRGKGGNDHAPPGASRSWTTMGLPVADRRDQHPNAEPLWKPMTMPK